MHYYEVYENLSPALMLWFILCSWRHSLFSITILLLLVTILSKYFFGKTIFMTTSTIYKYKVYLNSTDTIILHYPFYWPLLCDNYNLPGMI